MKGTAVNLARYFLLLLFAFILLGCSPAKTADNPNLIWAVSLAKSEIKQKLEIVETVKQYNGSTDEFHQQIPTDGNVYLLLKLTVKKQGAGATPFDWSKLVVQDSSGKTYQRNSNDAFLEQYKYTPRMTGLEIKLGVHEGWVCYEIPSQAAEGKISLVYNSEGSQQEIEVKK